MVWWIVLAVVITFGAAIFLKVTRASTVLGSLNLCHHTPREFYWTLCVPAGGIALVVQFALASHPVPEERVRDLFMEPWPNFAGSVGAVEPWPRRCDLAQPLLPG